VIGCLSDGVQSSRWFDPQNAMPFEYLPHFARAFELIDLLVGRNCINFSFNRSAFQRQYQP
jgi:hypothetical protein